MQRWNFYSLTDGVLQKGVYIGDRLGAEMNAPDGCAPIAGVSDAASQRVDITTGALVDFQPPPPADDELQTWAWHDGARRWLSLPTLAASKARRWAAVKLDRRRFETGTFTLNGMTFDANESKLAGAALDAFMAQSAGEPWSQSWVLADNTVVVLDAAQMIAAGRACKARISALWAQSQAMRALIDAATTAEEVAAVVWPAQNAGA
jgi:hypothetical protein